MKSRKPRRDRQSGRKRKERETLFEYYRQNEYRMLLHIDYIVNFNGDYMQKHMERKVDTEPCLDYMCGFGRDVSSNIPDNDFVRLEKCSWAFSHS